MYFVYSSIDKFVNVDYPIIKVLAIYLLLFLFNPGTLYEDELLTQQASACAMRHRFPFNNLMYTITQHCP